MIFFKNTSSTTTTTTTTSPDARECRCTFDAAGNRVKCVLVDCVICGRSKVFGGMIKCDACHRFAHRRCVLGALNTGQRSGHLIVRAQVACGADQEEVGVDAATQTSLTTCDVASGDDKIFVDGWSQAIVATCDVASGDDKIFVDGYSQATVATCEVATGDDKIFVDGYSQATVATCEVATGDDKIFVDGYSQATVATCEVATGDETVYVDGCSQHSEATSSVVPGEVIVHVDDFPRVDVAASRDESVVPPAAVATVSATPSTNPESRSSIGSTRKSTLSRTLNYWNLRYSLFSKFDQGIMLDEVSMYSVCPEVLAEHMAKRCAFDTVLDPFCGAGGNAIQSAFTCAHVIAIDSDPNKIMLARRNAEIYGVADRIEFKVGDWYQMVAGLRVDAVVTSPPWGGLGYQRVAKFDASYLGSRATGGMAAILKMVHAVAPKLVLRVPMNIDRMQCFNMAAKHGFGRIQYESVTIDRKPNCTNLYLTRKDTHASGSPVQTFKTINLNTQTSFGMQEMHRVRNNNIESYTSYIDSVTRFLAT